MGKGSLHIPECAKLGLFALFLSASSFAAPGAAPGDAPAPPETRSLTFRIPSEPETLDWNRAHTDVETYILMNVMEGLLDFDARMQPRGALAESWKLDPTGTIYTFKLRKNVRWSDGKALRAADFVYSWKRLLSPLTAASYAYLLFDVVGAEDFHTGKDSDFGKVGIRALDDETFQVRLKKPLAHWIYVPTFWVTFPLREDVVTLHGESWATPGRMVTLGPFMLASHEFGSNYVLKSNPTYYRAKGNLQQITAKIVADDSAALRMYDTGALDLLIGISNADLSSRPDLKTYPYLETAYLGFQTKAFPANNVHLRRAIAMAIDRSQLPALLKGKQTAATTFVPPGVLGYSPRIGLPFNVAQAKKELVLAGIDPSRPLEMNLISADQEKQGIIASFVQQQLKKNLGLEVGAQRREYKAFRLMLDLKTFPAFLLHWGADFPDPDNFLSVFLGDAGNNRFGWKNARYEQLVLDARSALDVRRRDAEYAEAQKLLLEQEAVILPLFYEPNLALVRAGFIGVDLNPLNYLLLREVSRK